MLENPVPVMVRTESSNPQDGTEEFLGPELISTLLMTGVRHVAVLYWNLSTAVGAVAQSKVSTTVQSDEGANATPEDPRYKQLINCSNELFLYQWLDHGKPQYQSC